MPTSRWRDFAPNLIGLSLLAGAGYFMAARIRGPIEIRDTVWSCSFERMMFVAMPADIRSASPFLQRVRSRAAMNTPAPWAASRCTCASAGQYSESPSSAATPVRIFSRINRWKHRPPIQLAVVVQNGAPEQSHAIGSGAADSNESVTELWNQQIIPRGLQRTDPAPGFQIARSTP